MGIIKDKIRTCLTINEAAALKTTVMATTGCSASTYYRYLIGQCNDQNIGLAIAKTLNIPLEQLLDPAAGLLPRTSETLLTQEVI